MMRKTKKSNVEIVSLFLVETSFRKINTALRRTRIPATAIRLEATIEEIQEDSFATTFDLSVFEESDSRADFTAKLRYLIVSRSQGPEFKKETEGFARFGGPYNALIHARELLVGLTARAFGKAALLPLLDIRTFGSHIVFSSVKRAPNDSNKTESEPSAPGPSR